MTYQYSVKSLKENMAKALGVDLPISFKQSIEICNHIRGDKLSKAKLKLEAAINKKVPIPFKRFTNGIGHKKGKLSAGRYPHKASQEILKLLNSAESNALFKGLNSKGLVIAYIIVKKSSGAWHYGRQFRRKMKRCNIEVILEEVKQAVKDSKDKKQQKPDMKAGQKPKEEVAKGRTEVKQPLKETNVLPEKSKSALQEPNAAMQQQKPIPVQPKAPAQKPTSKAEQPKSAEIPKEKLEEKSADKMENKENNSVTQNKNNKPAEEK